MAIKAVLSMPFRMKQVIERYYRSKNWTAASFTHATAKVLEADLWFAKGGQYPSALVWRNNMTHKYRELIEGVMCQWKLKAP